MLICCLGLSAVSTIFAEVNAANVVSIEKIDNCYAPKFNELSDFFETEDSYEVYLVGIVKIGK